MSLVYFIHKTQTLLHFSDNNEIIIKIILQNSQ